ncbi:S8 family peptidase [Fictibacillus nanhaiensis]|uniref:S8 family peptidase n=1 Tax=Fictibacillus nanhaiensis TaxID=742169 RepID=UPI002E234534|nr:S8 family peptidase [Fictibacillus nanhaiensis]
MNEIYLLPMTVENVREQINKIPKGVKLIKAPMVWKESKQGEGRVIAVLDTGCEIHHPDLIDNILGVYNFTEDDNGASSIVTDYLGHGTHVAGIISAKQNEAGVVGVAPKSKLLILKVIGKSGKGNIGDLIQALKYAIHWRGDNGEKVDVINLSLGGIQDDPDLYEQVQLAVKEGIFIVAAAGNFGDGNDLTDEILYPAYYVETIQVGALSENMMIMDFSNTNDRIDLVAPGENILSTYLHGSYAKLSGTSMAAPHVSGAIALLKNLSINIETNIPNYINFRLVKDALSLGHSINLEGSGLIQLEGRKELWT